MAYERINWQNEPSEATALNDVNLNKMDSAIYDHDTRLDAAEGTISSQGSAITALQNGKVDKETGKGLSQVDNVTVTQHVAYGTVVSTIRTYKQDGTEVTSQVCNGIVVDSALSDSSTNPVQNKVVKSALDDKVDKVANYGLSLYKGIGYYQTAEGQVGTQIGYIGGIKQNGQLQGLGDIYNGVVVDSALDSSSENPVQNKVVKNAIDAKSSVSISDTLADGDTIANVTIDGVTTPIKASQPKSEEMNVRSAMMLLTPPISNNAPYVKRVVGGGITNPYLCKLKKLIGASVVWNQLVKNGNFANTSVWQTINASLSVSGGIGTFTSSSTNMAIFQSRPERSVNHIYRIVFEHSVDSGTQDVVLYWGSSSVLTVTASTTKTRVEKIIKITTESANVNLNFAVNGIGSGGKYNISAVQLTDLTTMFGTTIADYVNTLETQTAGSGIAWLKSYGFFTKDYYAYSANTIQSVSVSTKVNKDSEDTTISTVALDHTTLRGLFKLDANNNLYADGDEYPSDGNGDVKYAVVDLGTINWLRNSTYNVYYAPIPGKVEGKTNILSAKYVTVNKRFSDLLDKEMTGVSNTLTQNDNINIKDDDYNNVTDFKNAMSGVKLVYQLATPTTAELTPFTELQNIESGGTEEFIDYGVEQGTRDVAIPCGQESEYNSGVSVPNLPTSGGKVELTYNPANGQFTWE